MRWQRFAVLLIFLLGIGAGLVAYKNPFHLGLDIKGGIHLVLEAQDTDKRKVDDEVMRAAMAVVRNRVDGFGVAEPLLQRKGDRQIIVDLPGIDDPNRAVKLLGETAKLTFRKQAPGLKVDEPAWVETGVTGEMLKNAYSGTTTPGQWAVFFEFNPEGAKKFGQLTTELSGKPLGIFLDEKLVSSPMVNEPITGGNGYIHGSFTPQEANDLAIKLKAGQLPVPLVMVENRTVGPTLGKEAVNASLKAGLIGLGFVLVFMIAWYRLPGVLSAFALMIYTALSLAIFNLIPVTLTVPGIAGFILSIGMAVDANVLIFERMKEEIKSGKTLYNAVDAGFSRAFSSIFDSNMTTIISCAVLFYFGTGLIRGFAMTLAVGVAVSMFSAITVTRSFLKAVITYRSFKNPSYYGVKPPKVTV